MRNDEKRSLIESYLNAYNTFDIDGMMAVMHPDIEFKNVSCGEVNAESSGIDALRQMAEQSKSLFSSRRQTVTRFEANQDETFIEVDYVGILPVDLPNGMKKGETLRLTGRSEFDFKDGKISKITDIS